MDSETLAGIAAQYPWASWAVWNDEFPEDKVDPNSQNVEVSDDNAAMLLEQLRLPGGVGCD